MTTPRRNNSFSSLERQTGVTEHVLKDTRACRFLFHAVADISLLEGQGITVDERSFTCRGSMGPLHSGHPNEEDLDSLRRFVEALK